MLTKINGKQHDNKAYVITGPEALSYYQVAELISNEIGRKISHADIPEEPARNAFKGIGREEWLVDAILDEFYNSKVGNRSKTTNGVKKIIGRKPISFAQFVKDYSSSFI